MLDIKLILLLLPIILIQIFLLTFALLKLISKKESKYLNKTIWFFIVIFVNIFGPIAFLVLEGDK